MKIQKVKLFPNLNDKSQELAIKLENKLINYGYQISNQDYDLAIAIGGDGSFLRMIKENQFDSNVYYIGVNTGTLGFLQEINPNELNCFLKKLQTEFYKIEQLGIQETKITTKTEQVQFYSLNDIVIREQDLKKTSIEICVDDELLENYTGDGLIISTSIGSTAYNLSLGGSIVYNDLHTLQITPIAPFNTEAYRNILNSVIIPEHKTIYLSPKSSSCNLILSIDGENKLYQDVISIETSVSEKKISCLRMKDYNSTKIIHDKFLK